MVERNSLVQSVDHFPIGLAPAHLPAWSLDSLQCAVLAVSSIPPLLSLHPDSIIRKALYPAPLLLISGAFLAPAPLLLHNKEETYKYGKFLSVWLFTILDRLYLNQPEESFKRKGIDDAEDGEGPESLPPAQKILWATELITISRGVGWNWQVGGTPPAPTDGRRTFLVKRTMKVLAEYASVIATQSICKWLLTRSSLPDGFLTNTALRFLLWWGYFSITHMDMSFQEDLLSIIFVGLGIGKRWSQPSAWPPAFGSAASAYSFRNFWGKWWHQSWRRILTSPGMFLVNLVPSLRTPKTSTMNKIKRSFLILSTFAMSAIIHASGSYYVNRGSKRFSAGGALAFYGSQAAILIGEDAILTSLGIDDRKPPTLTRRLVGYAIIGLYSMILVPEKLVSGARGQGMNVVGNELLSGVAYLGSRAAESLANPFPALFIVRMLVEKYVLSVVGYRSLGVSSANKTRI